MPRAIAAFVAALFAVLATGALSFGQTAPPSAASIAAAQVPPELGPNVTVKRLAGGGSAIVRQLPGAPVAAVQLWFRAPSIGFESDPHPGIARLAALAIAASVPITGTPLGQAVQRAGGRFGIATYPSTISISALVPSSQAAAVLRTMSAVYFTPVLTAQGLAQAVEQQKSEERLRELAAPEETLRDALFEALFPKGALHFPPGGDGSEGALTLDVVRAFATRAFRASNTIAVLTGTIDPTLSDAAVEGRADAAAPEALATPAPAPTTLERRAPIGGFGYAWAGPPIASESDATALDFISDYLFGDSTGTVTRATAALDVSITAQFVTYYDPGVLFVEATGKDIAGGRAAIDAGLASVRTPLDPVEFARAINRFEYRLFSDVSTPLPLADNFGWYAAEGNAAYAPGADVLSGHYVRALRALTPAGVARVVAQYLGPAPATVTFTPIAPTKAVQ